MSFVKLSKIFCGVPEGAEIGGRVPRVLVVVDDEIMEDMLVEPRMVVLFHMDTIRDHSCKMFLSVGPSPSSSTKPFVGG